jgi:hypothetical protein
MAIWTSLAAGAVGGVVGPPLVKPVARGFLVAGMSLPSMVLDAWTEVRREANAIRLARASEAISSDDVIAALNDLKAEIAEIRTDISKKKGL